LIYETPAVQKIRRKIYLTNPQQCWGLIGGKEGDKEKTGM
jgi:hypothetical protein